MFTGIVNAIGKIVRIDSSNDSSRIAITAGKLDLSDVALGDSIAVSGPCLTVIANGRNEFVVDVSSETLARTTLGSKRIGDGVNLEKALRLSDRLGGHLVSGHVDGVGSILDRVAQDGYVQFRVAAPGDLGKYIATKGSVSIDGVSLTVNAIGSDEFELMIIPHTLNETTLGDLEPGDNVNIEIDLIARYLERLADFSDEMDTDPISLEMLDRAGFISS